MADKATSALDRLENKAAESNRSYQLCMKMFCQEEFLRRSEKSRFAENFAQKGSLFIYTITDFDSRITMEEKGQRKISAGHHWNQMPKAKIYAVSIMYIENGGFF